MIVLTANDFASGAVVYFSYDAWTLSIDQAQVFSDEDAAQNPLKSAHDNPDLVIGAYLIKVRKTKGVITPIHIREAIRSSGPSHHHPPSNKGVRHVSLS